MNLLAVVDRHDAAQRECRQLFDEGFREGVEFGGQQLLERFGTVVLSAVGEGSASEDGRVVAEAPGDLLSRAPAADGIVVFESEAERVDLAMAGRTDRVRRVRLKLIANCRLGFVARSRLERLDIWRRRRRRA